MSRRRWTRPFLILAWLYVLLEFVTYDLLQALVIGFARCLPLRAFEAWVRRQSIWSSFTLLLLPLILLVPFKFFELWLFLNHHYFSGVLALIAAKLAGTAFVAYLFSLTKPVLMTVPRFARFYNWVIAWRERVLEPVLSSALYHRMNLLRRSLRERWSTWRTLSRQRWWGRTLARLRYSRRTI